jgi:hypothetical protein
MTGPRRVRGAKHRALKFFNSVIMRALLLDTPLFSTPVAPATRRLESNHFRIYIPLL